MLLIDLFCYKIDLSIGESNLGNYASLINSDFTSLFTSTPPSGNSNEYLLFSYRRPITPSLQTIRNPHYSFLNNALINPSSFAFFLG